MSAPKSYPLNSAVLKALKVLELVAKDPRPVGFAELARRMEEDISVAYSSEPLSPATLRSHLATLEHAGYLEQTQDGWQMAPKLGIFWAAKKAAAQRELSRTRALLTQLDGIEEANHAF